MKWIIVFYNKKVETGLLKWPAKLRAKLSRILELIELEGGDLGLPFTRAMGNNLFEIRVKAQSGIGRVFYAYVKKREIIILHSFIKKTQETPKKELDLAKKDLKR